MTTYTITHQATQHGWDTTLHTLAAATCLTGLTRYLFGEH